MFVSKCNIVIEPQSVFSHRLVVADM
ncbi:hypothetical protein AGRO_5296 [Agrobacterium sp. ATCC 31749]|nr:hypothetical protein AGRO_5296 [Agrobacterium sp. ATCC 31749]